LLKAYEQGRGKWQANTVNFVWFDEEPPADVYFEGITRTNATKGRIALTFTPLQGMSDVVSRFLMEESPDRATITMTIDDAEHYTPEERDRIIASYPPHEREARTKGIPSMGSGLIFPVPEEDIVCEPIAIPEIWPQIIGVDFGWDHPFAAVRLAWDRDADVIYVIGEYRQREASPIIHAASIKPWGEWIPVAWPHDGLQHDKGSGEQLAAQYRAQGLAMTHDRATFDDGTSGVEAGVSDMLQRMQTGRWKVFNTCRGWLDERRIYHRKDGRIVKERDDLISASRYALMMKRFAIVKPSAEPKFVRRNII
jgi:phage terminase large subunit-like protein